MTLWLEDGRLRWKACNPPPPSLLAELRDRREELLEALQPTPGAAALLAFTEASAAAMAEREPDPDEDAERAAIFGLPPLVQAIPGSRALPLPESDMLCAAAKRPLSESQTMERRIYALLRAPGVEVVVERDGWLRISSPSGAYALWNAGDASILGWHAKGRNQVEVFNDAVQRTGPATETD
jgi:hypothetical protein